MNPEKYSPVELGVTIKERKWPSNRITKAPIWCSVDLRDGNQALSTPMDVERKLEFFDMLVKLGFKEIEVGFPSSSETEYVFIRRLIEEKRIPKDVTIQVLCQARKELVEKTVEAVKGCDSVIFHLYTSTSPAQRSYTFGKTKDEIKRLSVEGVRCIKSCLEESDRERIALEYSPESFSHTELDYAVEICEAVRKEWGTFGKRKIIFNLPTTVECYMPNVYADAIEYFASSISDRENVIISTHCHNDRGTGVASCELALLAGADRVEGCLFGNGERTGNLDIVNVALNMFSQGIDPHLDFSNLMDTASMYTNFTQMDISPRTPYAGEYVFTAFSGSHQDAIKKALLARKEMKSDSPWNVPYLLIDPHDIGREYEGIIRINSQSGKSGVSYILESEYGICLPREMQKVFGRVVKNFADRFQCELKSDDIYRIFESTWLATTSPLNILVLVERHVEGARGCEENSQQVACMATIEYNGEKKAISANGNGPLNAFVNALKMASVPDFNITYFQEHSIGKGSGTKALAYVQITLSDGTTKWGAGRSSNVSRAGIAAVVSALNFRDFGKTLPRES